MERRTPFHTNRHLRALDLLLFNRTPDPYGAHIALYLGEGRAIHLSKQVGRPAEWSLEEFAQLPEYSVLIGAKRPLRPGRAERR